MGLDMKHQDARRLLHQIGVLRHPCDLDVLLFFARHPRSLITSEQLAAWLGYELKQIADSLEVLLTAETLTRTLNPTHAARMYVLNIGGGGSGWLPSLLAYATTREGRLAMIEVLSSREPDRSDAAPLASSEQRVSHVSPAPGRAR